MENAKDNSIYLRNNCISFFPIIQGYTQLPGDVARYIAAVLCVLFWTYDLKGTGTTLFCKTDVQTALYRVAP